jgi:hypothetical protein
MGIQNELIDFRVNGQLEEMKDVNGNYLIYLLPLKS